MKHPHPKFIAALKFAAELHSTHRRKGADVAYVSHLLGVTSLVLEASGSETEAIAALLHDAIEDRSHIHGGAPALRKVIRRKFGSEVLNIVEACTDSDTTPKPPWRQRKEAYLSHLETAERSSLMVSCADKLHNARAILTDLRTEGPKTWSRFNASSSDVIWYYTSLARCFSRRMPGRLASELSLTVAAIKRAANAMSRRSH